MPSKEECVSGTEQKLQRPNDAATKVVQIRLRVEECALGMGQSADYAAKKDAKIKSSKEECA